MFSLFQPLMDNLESQTYEIFERDPIKYREYERVRRKFFLLTPPTGLMFQWFVPNKDNLI